jgi:phosphoribosylformylglycinamidine synthase
MSLLHFYRTPSLSESARLALLDRARTHVSPDIAGITSEFCFNVETAGPLGDPEMRILTWLLSETFEPQGFGMSSFLLDGIEEEALRAGACGARLVEVGPRMSFTTAWSTNAVSVCHACGVHSIRRIERSRRYLIQADGGLDDEQVDKFLRLVHDRMTECPYPAALETFEHGIKPEPVRAIPVVERGRLALEHENRSMGLAFDDWDLDYYTRLFRDDVGRDPTDVELFDIAQSNSEHSRHWFFKGRLVIDGMEAPRNLMELLQAPLDANPGNSVIAFKDNSSGIRGYRIRTLVPEQPGQPGRMVPAEADYHIIFTAETHNFPSGVAPFPGAEKGLAGGGRNRGLLRRQPLHPGLRASVGGPPVRIPVEPGHPARDRDRGIERGIRLRKQVR